MDTRLKEIRKSKGFKSARAFAESIGMQEKTYRNYEQGARNLYLDVACELCAALGCSLDELVGREKPPACRLLPLSREEEELIVLYRRMTFDMENTLLETARNFAALSGEGKNRSRAAFEQLVESAFN